MDDVLREATALRQVGNKQVLAAVIASCLGWALDLFDLFVILFVAPIVGRLFFPSTNAMLSLAAVYASFAVTLLMRPLGSAIFGSVADRYGRKRAMIVAVVGVGLATASFGLLPTVPQVGVAAPIMFLILRLVQGIFVGGVVASTHTIGTETVEFKYRGAVSGLVGGGGAGIGALLASIVYLATSAAFPGSAFEVWGWRCMFFAGIVSSALGVFVFKSLEESPVWAAVAEQKRRAAAARKAAGERARSPLSLLFSKKYRSVLLVNLLLTIGGGSGYYLTSGYLPTFLKVVNHTPNGAAGLILMISSLAVLVASVAAGHLSTLIGRKRAFIWLGIARLVCFPLLYVALARADSIASVGFYAALLSALGSAGYAPVLIFLNERFPTSIRASGTGLSWNIGFAIGGIMPTVVSMLAHTPRELPSVLAGALVLVSIVFLVGAFVVPETLGRLPEDA
ncbi:sugar phosphate permease [Trinickia symbiotica]|uniref:MFS transporter n=1 Tax=Trinickia symbiotica TaxID=863227 RepID=A0A2N7X142_9BURK|nr:MFS transporter [Trinickia symbiotica]PMS35463.1 MFS transporter [Trinickia symbiotica]PPK45490.1 sugar phosphate permease [Trinickia symbiotica]